jgi:hypothetical protein
MAGEVARGQRVGEGRVIGGAVVIGVGEVVHRRASTRDRLDRERSLLALVGDRVADIRTVA